MSLHLVEESHDNGEYRARFEIDYLEYARERIEQHRKELQDGAYDVALAKIGYVKQRECRIDGGECTYCGAHIDENACKYWKPTGKGLETIEKRDVLFCPRCGAKVASDEEWSMDDVRDLIERHSDEIGGNGRRFHNGAYARIAEELNGARVVE